MSQPRNAPARYGSKKLIYVVDDKPALVELAKIGLEVAGYSVVGFENPEHVLTALHDADPVPHLLITDFDMPEMNGLELIRKCRCILPEMKIVVLSGTVEESEIMSDPVKVDRFLRKPYQPRYLMRIVGELLPR